MPTWLGSRRSVGTMSLPCLPNHEIAAALERVADLLETQGADRYRVGAYRRASRTLSEWPRPVAALLAAGGCEALESLPGIGRTIASHVSELVKAGRLSLLERLEGQLSPEDLLMTVPGIGERLAARIHHELVVETLEELEIAAHDSRLAALPGFGARRVRGARESLAAVLGRAGRARARRLRWLASRGQPPGGEEWPSVAMLLAVDGEYRRRASAGDLHTITPRRFNPERYAWLPVLHVEKDGWSLTALYSNTARAHRLGTTRDWVVIYYKRGGEEDQCTVVTERIGRLVGQRVVRGREAECGRHYAECA